MYHVVMFLSFFVLWFEFTSYLGYSHYAHNDEMLHTEYMMKY